MKISEYPPPPPPPPQGLYHTQIRHHVINLTYSHRVIYSFSQSRLDETELKILSTHNITILCGKSSNQVQPTLFRRDNESCIPLSQIDVRCNYKICFGIRLPPFSSFCIDSTVTFCCQNVILTLNQNFIHNKLPLVFIENFQPLI